MDKAKRKSKSMEEISRIPTADGLARTHETRLSLPAQTHGKRKVIHPPISDVDRIEEEDDEFVTVDIGKESEDVKKAVRGSQLSGKSHRSRTASSGSRTPRENSGTKKKEYGSYENKAYEGNLDQISVVSTRASSVQSLEVQREQYCCLTKWSPCERKLAALVAVLATIIIILAIAVGVLATGRGVETRFQWSF